MRTGTAQQLGTLVTAALLTLGQERAPPLPPRPHQPLLQHP